MPSLHSTWPKTLFGSKLTEQKTAAAKRADGVREIAGDSRLTDALAAMQMHPGRPCLSCMPHYCPPFFLLPDTFALLRSCDCSARADTPCHTTARAHRKQRRQRIKATMRQKSVESYRTRAGNDHIRSIRHGRFRCCVRMRLLSWLLTAGDGLVESSERMSGRECEHADAVAVRVNRVVVIRVWTRTSGTVRTTTNVSKCARHESIHPHAVRSSFFLRHPSRVHRFVFARVHR